jgi:hypothetical protein
VGQVIDVTDQCSRPGPAGPVLNSQTLQYATGGLGAPSRDSQALQFATNNLGAPSLNSQVLQQATGGLDSGATTLIANAAALNTTVAALQSAQTAADSFKASTAASTLAMQAENNASGFCLAQALSGLGGDDLGVAQANTQFNTGLLTLKGTLQSNHEAVTGNTTAALANQAALQQQVAAAQAIYQATAQQTGSTVQGKAAYDAAITSIEKSTGATGAQKVAVDQYVASISTIPPVANTQADFDHSAADKAIADFENQLKHIPGTVITSEAVSRSDAAGYSAHAAGGPLTQGWNLTGEAGPEWLYKAGQQVQAYNAHQTAALTPTPQSGATIVVNPSAGLDEVGIAALVSRRLQFMGA